MILRPFTGRHLKWMMLALSMLTVSLSAKTYITEEKVQIDRCACAWFISRFLDEKPTFVFIKQGQKPPEGVTYDFFGAAYFHKGPDCSFTAFIKKHIRKKDPALIKVNAIVNDVFAWRNGPNSLSVAIKEHIDQLAKQGKTDVQIYQECLTIFDLLYLTGKGTETNMHKPGKVSLAATEQQVLDRIYGDSLPLSSTQSATLGKANKTPTLNAKLLKNILESNKPKQPNSLHTLALRILGKK